MTIETIVMCLAVRLSQPALTNIGGDRVLNSTCEANALPTERSHRDS